MGKQRSNFTDENSGIYERQNPLEERLGRDFFKDLPRQPGVYKMYSQIDTLLYVGKAKNLRKRLLQYRRVSGNERKRARLVQATHRIELEVLEHELDALLRENRLLRELKPQYNVAKTHPESYYYVGFSEVEDQLQFELTMSYSPDRFDWLFGAFKGHRLVRSGMGALLRQLWLVNNRQYSVFNFPPVLTKNLTADFFELEWRKGQPAKEAGLHTDRIRAFLKGEDDALIRRINEFAWEEGLLDEFIGKLVLEDLEQMQQFYQRCLKRNFDMYQSLELESYCIPQNRLDDCLVRYAFQKDK